jgi:SAM-dependent methyltransferase
VTRPDRRTGFRHERHDGFLLVDSLEESPAGFAQSVVRGLSDHPRWLHCRYLYDAEGSDIFERICEQPEYYQTRTEAALLAEHAAEIRALTEGATLVELGSGSSIKTRHLLRAWTAGGPAQYFPVDISHAMLRQSCAALAREHRGLEVRGVAASYERAFPLRLRRSSSCSWEHDRQLQPAGAPRLLDRVGEFSPGDHVPRHDLVKDIRTPRPPTTTPPGGAPPSRRTSSRA